MNPKISIIVPVYNVEKYLPKCIESILNQSFKNFELILINDGSTDKSGEICNKYSEIDKRIKVIHNKNIGLAGTRNVGLKISKGEYIGFIDSDDYISEDMFKLLYNSCIEENSDISTIGICEVDENYAKINEFIPKDIKFSELLKRAHACNKLYKKSLFIQNNLFYKEGRYYEDLELIPKIFILAKKISYVNHIGYFYLQRSNSITHSMDNKILDNLWAYTQIKYFLENNGIYGEYREEFDKGIKYFKWFFFTKLKNYPIRFILKYYRKIVSDFRVITNLTNKEIILFSIEYIQFKTKKYINI